jgi:chaperonin GroES
MSTPNVQPTNDRVIVKQDAAEEKKGSIVLPEDAKRRPHFGMIIATGPGRKRDDGSRVPMTRHVGDRVAYMDFAAQKIEVDDEELLILEENAILAVFLDPPKK